MKITIPRAQPSELPPMGMHHAVCYAVVDFGTQSGQFGPNRQIYIGWELPDAVTSRGRPFAVGKYYTIMPGSTPRKLKEDLEGWFGRAMQEDELCNLNLLDELLGRAATLGVVQGEKNGKRRADITAVMPPGRGAPVRAQTSNAPLRFGLEDGLDRAAYDILPGWMKAIIARSPEYKQAIAPEMAKGTTDERLKQHLGGGNGSPPPTGDLDDSIPFVTSAPAFEPYLKRKVV